MPPVLFFRHLALGKTLRFFLSASCLGLFFGHLAVVFSVCVSPRVRRLGFLPCVSCSILPLRRTGHPPSPIPDHRLSSFMHRRERGDVCRSRQRL